MTLGDSGCVRVFGGLTSHKIGVVGWGWRQKTTGTLLLSISIFSFFGLTVGFRQHIHASVGFRLKERQRLAQARVFFRS